ncbi:DUF4349 domain-containing protein [Actinotalea sp. M2MS4P-6]|uniref:DUF4349 domain-containing protein n=1 Tax=Actinotalea sp. M2MS4P-6 TaxID=2983762 RepID=UPI0021E39EAE|nr:DUF4349 domain-containing protein [Actinotalea sp. M2MS4P-6]MCV2393754.1 DUF4349 domain-containing protein [Actinotalea sp. M2MS4P-6]
MRSERLPASRRAPRRARRAVALAAALATSAMLVAGCSAGSSNDSAGSEAMAPASGGDMAYEDSAAVDEERAAASDGTASTADADRMVIVTGWVTVVVDDPIEKATRVVTLVESKGGFISARSQQSAGSDRRAYASLTARVPAERLQDVLDELEDLGEVQEAQLDSVEVTSQVRDLDARIKAMELSIARLEDLLQRSGDLSDIVQAEQVLTDRQSQLEQLESERASLADQVAMSTVTVNLYTDEAVPDEPPSGFLTGLESGWKALMAFGAWLLTVLGVLLPWLVVATVVGLVAWPFVRRARQKSADRRAAAQAARGQVPFGWATAPATAPVSTPPAPPVAAPMAPADAAPSPDTSADGSEDDPPQG